MELLYLYYKEIFAAQILLRLRAAVQELERQNQAPRGQQGGDLT